MEHEPQTLSDAIKFFADKDRALATMVRLRWPDGVSCPTCGRVDVRFIATRRMWECKEKHPKRQFSAKVGTIFEDSPLGLDVWFSAMWMIANCKNGVSSYEIHRALGITQKSAWFVLHRVRLAMKTGSFLKSVGEFEADESFFGGQAKNMHKHKREQTIKSRGAHSKTAVLGILRRKSNKTGSKVKAAVVPDLKGRTLKPAIREIAEVGSIIFTDSLSSYRGIGGVDYTHHVVDHAIEYVRDNVHVNGLENFWSLMKRTVKGTYVSVAPFHLDSYLDEQCFRFNERDGNDADRFKSVASSVAGKRLTYKQLTGK